MGSQHPSRNVKTLCNFEPNFWPETIASSDAKSACFKGSKTSCDVINLGIFLPNFCQKRSHHVMDASCRLDHIFCSFSQRFLDTRTNSPRKPPNIRRLFVTCGVFTRYFFMVFSWLFRGPLLSRKTVFGPFSWFYVVFFMVFSWPPFWANFTRTRPGTVF